MRSAIALTLAALALLFSASALRAATPEVTLVMPFDGAVVRAPEVLVLFQTPPGFKPIVTQDGFKVKVGKYVPGNTYDLHHLDVELKEGLNKLLWTDPDTEKLVFETSLYFVPRQSRKIAPGMKDKQFNFHTKEFEKRCDECHPMPEEMETVPGKPMSPAGKVCSSCHMSIGNVKRSHEPTAVYDCFRCHQPQYKPKRFTARSSQSALCSECHQNFTEHILGSNKFVHGPAASGDCNTCHNPHGGESVGLLREPVVALCMRCHADTVALRTPNSLHMSVDCDKCHNPHGANNMDLTRKPRAELCLDCHEDPMKKLAGHPIQNHPATAPIDPSKPGRPMTCTSCHEIHGKEDISKLNIFENNELQRKFCLRCHY